MGKFKDVGNPSLALMEEMAEAIQVIAKKHRFNGDWHEIPEGKDKTRWQELQAEMADVFYQWFRLKDEIHGKRYKKVISFDNYEDEERYDRAHYPEESWDGDETDKINY